MYIKPNIAGKNIRLRAQTLNQKLKQNAQTQDDDGVQAFFYVIYDTFRGHISTLILFMGGGFRATFTLRFRWGSGRVTCNTLKQKLFDISRRSQLVKFFQ